MEGLIQHIIHPNEKNCFMGCCPISSKLKGRTFITGNSIIEKIPKRNARL